MISIIVPVYNTEKYLDKCINSIIKQTYHDFELLLIDDGSNDNSYNICHRYSEYDKRIKCYHTNNQGAAAARNFGIKLCTGDYITFIDSDDWIDADYLEVMVKYADKYDIVQVGNHVYSSDGNQNIVDQNNEELLSVMEPSTISRALLEGKYQAGGVPWGKLYQRHLWEQICFPKIRRYEDVAILYRIYWNANKIKIVHEAKYCYRSQRSGSIMHSPFSVEWYEIIEISRDRILFYEEKKEYNLVTLAEFELLNQIIMLIKKTKLYLPNEKELINELIGYLHDEMFKLFSRKGFYVKKTKMIVKSILAIL